MGIQILGHVGLGQIFSLYKGFDYFQLKVRTEQNIKYSVNDII